MVIMFKRVLSGIAALAVSVGGLPVLETTAAAAAEPADTAIEILGQSPVYTNRDMCYRIYHANNANWLAEQQFCMESGGTLVRIGDEEEQRVIEMTATPMQQAHLFRGSAM